MRVTKSNSIFFLAIAIKLIFVGIAYVLPVSVLGRFGVSSDGHGVLVNYAPEVWLSLLALVFGTLIIVVSIASENTPKLIDLFIGDPKGRLYIWLIMLSSLENIYLQIFSARPAMFFSNVIFINNYVLLPCFVLLAIPYAFYILRYTKNANVIEHIYSENMRALHSVNSHSPALDRNKLVMFETINQLHDLLQYIQFKEPKGDIISRLGKSARAYLEIKRTFPDSYFKLSDSLKNDISFRTLTEKYGQIEIERTFYEQKVLRVLGTTYLLLVKEGHYELASLCGSELFEIGKTAASFDDRHVINSIIVHFNTFLRYGMNQGLKNKEIRNVYNTIYHYSQLVHLFIERKENDNVLRCCNYFDLYAQEIAEMSRSESLFITLIEVISWELKKILVSLYTNSFSRDIQRAVLSNMPGLKSTENRRNHLIPNDRDGVRLILVSLSLFYMSKGETEFNDIVVDSIIGDLKELNIADASDTIVNDCNILNNEAEGFWEETDQGNRNIFYTQNKDQIKKFIEYFALRTRRY